MLKSTYISSALLLSLLVATSLSPSFADEFQKKHPRKTEVLNKDARLNNQVNQDYR